MSQQQTFNTSGGGGSGIIQTIAGDTGTPITGANVTIFANQAINNSGSSVYFDNGGTVSTLNVTDVNTNTLIGNTTGNLTISGSENVGLGYSVLSQLTSASFNTCIGDLAGGQLTTGGENVALGYRALASSNADALNTAIGYGAMVNTNGGQFNVAVGPVAGGNIISGSSNIVMGSNAANSYGGAESDNILFNSFGINGENNTLHIGDITGTGTGTNSLNAAYIQGIYSNTQPISGTVEYVTIDNTTGLLGVTSTAAGSITIDGDVGSITGATVTIYADVADLNSGSSVSFVNSGTVSTLNLSDANLNTILGNIAGNASITGTENVSVGYSSSPVLTTGTSNTAVGTQSLLNLTSGLFNIALGSTSGYQYNSSESSNITINNSGVTSESNVLRIGAGTGTSDQQLDKAFISGINGNTVSNTMMVTIDSSTDQLGVQAIPSGQLTWLDEGSSFPASANTGYFCTAPLTVTLPASPNQGDVINIAVDFVTSPGNAVIVQANTGQTIRTSNMDTSSGGTATNTAQGDALSLVYRAFSAEWFSLSTEGSWILA